MRTFAIHWELSGERGSFHKLLTIPTNASAATGASVGATAQPLGSLLHGLWMRRVMTHKAEQVNREATALLIAAALIGSSFVPASADAKGWRTHRHRYYHTRSAEQIAADEASNKEWARQIAITPKPVLEALEDAQRQSVADYTQIQELKDELSAARLEAGAKVTIGWLWLQSLIVCIISAFAGLAIGLGSKDDRK